MLHFHQLTFSQLISESMNALQFTHNFFFFSPVSLLNLLKYVQDISSTASSQVWMDSHTATHLKKNNTSNRLQLTGLAAKSIHLKHKHVPIVQTLTGKFTANNNCWGRENRCHCHQADPLTQYFHVGKLKLPVKHTNKSRH